jgi:diguanylate cyclase (GGDEF)-like protein
MSATAVDWGRVLAGRAHWHARPEVAVLALGSAVSGFSCAMSALVPFSPTTPRALAAGLGVVALGLAAALVVWGARVRTWQLHAAVIVTLVLTTWFVAASTTPAGVVVSALAFLWVAIYCALFFEHRVVAAYVVALGAGLGLGLALAAATSPVHTWVLVMALVVGVSAVVSALTAALRQQATRDPLTGVLNRRALLQEAQREIARATRRGTPVSMAILDFDDFKAINDREGHTAGDDVLVSTTRVWRESLRPEDVLGRFGGDEFMVILPGATCADAAHVVERLDSVTDSAFSAGIAQWEGDPFDAWLRRADGALYARKHGSGAGEDAGVLCDDCPGQG